MSNVSCDALVRFSVSSRFECNPTSVKLCYTVTPHYSRRQKTRTKRTVKIEKCVISFHWDLRTSHGIPTWEKILNGSIWFSVVGLCVCSACVVCVFCGRDTRSVSGSKKIPRGPKGRFWAAARARQGQAGAVEAVGPTADRAQGTGQGSAEGPCVLPCVLALWKKI